MHLMVFLVATWFASYALLIGRFDSAAYLMILGLAAFVLAGLKKG